MYLDVFAMKRSSPAYQRSAICIVILQFSKTFQVLRMKKPQCTMIIFFSQVNVLYSTIGIFHNQVRIWIRLLFFMVDFFGAKDIHC